MRMRLGVGSGVAVVIGAARRHESVPRRDGADGLNCDLVERAVVDLETAETCLDELADDVLALGRLAEMGKRRQPTRCPDRGDCRRL